MKSTVAKKPGSVIHLEVKLTAEEFKPYWEAAFEDQLGKVHLKGFRPGQAPRELATKAVQTSVVFEQAADAAVRKTLHDLVEEHQWTVIDRPQVAIGTEGNDFEFEVDLTLFPEVTLGNYKKIARDITAETNEAVQKAAVEPHEVEQAYAWLEKSGANLKNFKDNTEVKKSIQEGLLMEKQEREREKGRLKILEAIAKSATVEVPQVMIERTKAQGLTEEQARRDVMNHLVIYKIAQKEQLNPTDEEVQKEVEAHLSRGEKIDREKLYNYNYGVLQNRKVFQFLESQ